MRNNLYSDCMFYLEIRCKALFINSQSLWMERCNNSRYKFCREWSFWCHVPDTPNALDLCWCSSSLHAVSQWLGRDWGETTHFGWAITEALQSHDHMLQGWQTWKDWTKKIWPQWLRPHAFRVLSLRISCSQDSWEHETWWWYGSYHVNMHSSKAASMDWGTLPCDLYHIKYVLLNLTHDHFGTIGTAPWAPFLSAFRVESCVWNSNQCVTSFHCASKIRLTRHAGTRIVGKISMVSIETRNYAWIQHPGTARFMLEKLLQPWMDHDDHAMLCYAWRLHLVSSVTLCDM